MMRPVRLVLVAASPVYYQAPLYRRIAADPRIDFTAVFASSAGVRPDDLGYGRPLAFDVDALSGFPSTFLQRAEAATIGSGSFWRHRDLDVVRSLLRFRPEVLWSHGYNSLTHILAVATQMGRLSPLLVREEQTLLDSRPFWKSALKEIGLRALLARAHALYIGTENRRWFSRYGVSARRQFFVPYAVENDDLRADAARLKPNAAAIRRVLGIELDAGPVILTVARLIPKKRPLFLLDAFRLVRAERRCALLIVGSGPLEEEARKFVKETGTPDVVFAGFVEQSRIAHVYAAADVFALASGWDETWGISVNEALNFALPVVVTDRVGCAADLVRHGVNGYVVAASNHREFARRLEILVKSPELREKFGRRSLEVVGDCTYERAAEGVLDAVAAAVGSARWTGAGAPGA